MFKRVMKMLGISLGIFAIVGAISIGIYALRGGFKENVINITKLYFDNDETKTKNTIYTLDDVSSRIDFFPLDATNKNLSVRVTSVGDVLANREELEKGIVAGEEFDLKIKKDAQGNNQGGVVNITATQGIAQVTLTLVVDVAIPDNIMYFSGNTNDKITAAGKTFTLAKSNRPTNVYLKSSLHNAFYLPVSESNMSTAKGNLKTTKFSYEYLDEHRNIIETKGEDEFEYTSIEEYIDPISHTSSFYYVLPIVAKESGYINIKARTHRTYAIQKEFEESGFDDVVSITKGQTATANAMKALYNEFLNKYISYFDNSDESYAFFRDHLNQDGSGKVKLETSKQIEESLSFVYVSATATIEVTSVNLNQIASTNEAREYDVFSTKYFSKENGLTIKGVLAESVYDAFGLSITLNDEDGKEVIESSGDASMFDTLTMTPYIYLDKDAVEAEDSIWKGYNTIAVYGFGLENEDDALTRRNNLPITDLYLATMPNDVREEYLSSHPIIGYLLGNTDVSKNKFFEVEELLTTSEDGVAGKTYWKVNFNVPMTKDINESGINKALYFRFGVKGINLKTSEEIYRETFNRVYINYSEYKFEADTDTYLRLVSMNETGNKVALNTEMALNDALKSESGSTSISMGSQSINIDTSKVLNFDGAYKEGSNVLANQVQYKSVMYFAETKSNTLEDSSKQIATIGKYKFETLKGEVIEFGSVDNPLVGERIPTYREVNGKKEYYIQTINASNMDDYNNLIPVRIFAVVYLSDRDGNPINRDGMRIVVDEANMETEATLYVISYSEITNSGMASITINNYIDNLNYYTTVASNLEVCKQTTEREDGFSGVAIAKDSLIKRNRLDHYTYSKDGVSYELSDSDMAEYRQFLKLKLLVDKPLRVYITNFELDEMGTVIDENKDISLSFKSINGKPIIMEYSQSTQANKQVAFDAFVSNFNSSYTVAKNENITIKIASLEEGEGFENTIALDIQAKSEGNGSETTIYMYGSDGVYSPYLSQPNRNNLVDVAVHSISISEVTLKEPQFKQLNAEYSAYSADMVPGTMNFYVKIAEDQHEKYNIPTIVTDGDNPSYAVSTNMGTEKGGEYEINLQVVDPSQAYFDGEGGIEEYIKKNAFNINSVKVEYLTTKNYAKLRNGIDFESSRGENIIKIGNKEYVIDATKQLVIEDITYDIEESVDDAGLITYRLRLPAGMIYPVLSIGSKNYVFMLGQEFEVETKLEGGKTYTIIVTGNNSGNRVENAIDLLGDGKFTLDGLNKNYNTSNYIKDNAFVTGDERMYTYISSTSGEYKMNDTYGFERIDPSTSYSGTKYDRIENKGVPAYMLVKMSFLPENPNSESGNIIYKTTKYKVFRYDLYQKDIVVKSYITENDGEKDVTVENNADHRLKLSGGKTTSIVLNPESKDETPNMMATDSTGNVKEEFFFYHVTFYNSSAYIKTLKVEGKTLNITTASVGVEQTASIVYRYKFKGENREGTLYVTITPNYEIKLADSGISTDEMYYIVNRNANSNIANFSTTIKTLLFSDSASSSKIKSLELILASSTAKYTYTNDNLNIDRNYKLLNEENKYIIFDIKITLYNNDVLTLDKKLKVDINSIAEIEYIGGNNVDNASVINNVIDIYGNIIKLYVNGEFKPYSSETIDLYSDFTITSMMSIDDGHTFEGQNPDAPALTLKDNKLSLEVNDNDVFIKLTIRDSRMQDVALAQVLFFKILGTNMFYLSDGSMTADTTKSNLLLDANAKNLYEEINKNLSITLTKNAEGKVNLDFSKYFAFFTSNSDTQDLYVGVKSDNETNYHFNTAFDITEDTTYKIYVIKMENHNYEIVSDTLFTITVNVVDA